MLQEVYKDVTRVLRECYDSAVLRECYESVMSVLQNCYKNVTTVLQSVRIVLEEC